jgi:hypothetical protein
LLGKEARVAKFGFQSSSIPAIQISRHKKGKDPVTDDAQQQAGNEQDENKLLHSGMGLSNLDFRHIL